MIELFHGKTIKVEVEAEVEVVVKVEVEVEVEVTGFRNNKSKMAIHLSNPHHLVVIPPLRTHSL